MNKYLFTPYPDNPCPDGQEVEISINSESTAKQIVKLFRLCCHLTFLVFDT